jgi:VanZ family protein
LRLFFAIGWLIVLAFGMLTPGEKIPEVDLFDFQDKAFHMISFFIQAYLWTGVGIKKEEINYKNPSIWRNFILFGILCGLGFEFSQQFIPNRSFEVMDMIANAIGASLGLLGYFKWPFVKYILE